MSERSKPPASDPDTADDPRRPQAPDYIGAYRLESVLGTGAMGVVYRAVGPDGRVAAVKVLNTSFASERLRRRFEREAQLRIDHPNVVQVLAAGTDDNGTPYIAFELLEGESLLARLDRGTLTPKEVVEVGVQACDGLAAAHDLGVVHRDLKPANLFLCADGTLKILDFGIALFEANQTRLTSTNAIIGTPAYLSPEQAKGDKDVDASTDVWALGAILYCALAGRAPFERDSVFATIVAVRMDELVPLSSLVPTVPHELAAVIARALSRDKADRWPTAKAFGEALARVDLTPAELVAALPDSGGPIAPGEKRVVAIMLADDVRSPELVEQTIRGWGGVVVPLLAGRTMGVFGGETWEGDEVIRAARAALEARGAARFLAVSSGHAELSGRAISGAALSAAERGCAAEVQGVAIDTETARSLEGRFSLVPIDPSLMRLTAMEDVALSTLEHEEISPILGREAELAQIRRALATTIDEERSIALLVTSPPGIGKSRLFREMERLIEDGAEPIRVLRAYAEPHRHEAALSLFGSVLANELSSEALSLGQTLSGATVSEEKRRSALLRLVSQAVGDDTRASECTEFLGALVGITMHESHLSRAARTDPQLMADHLRMALQDYFEGLCEQSPVALLLEDLHWADGASLDLVEDLLHRLADRPLLLFATARPGLLEHRPHFLEGGDVIRIDLRGLMSFDVARLAHSVTQHTLPESLVKAITRHTSGNPLFVEQIVLALKGGSTLDDDLERFPLPLTVDAAVQSRLDHLPSAEKELCKRAAIYARPFFADEVRALGVLNAGEVLRALCQHGVLVARGRSRGNRGRTYRFKSALVAEVAYRMVADSLRANLHRRAAAHLANAPTSDPGEVALHYEHGGDLIQAASYYAMAALAATHRADTPTVLRCSARALELGCPRSVRYALHMARADALRFHGDREDHGRELGQAEACAESGVDKARVLSERAALLARSGKLAEAAATAQSAVDAARPSGEPEVLTLALGRLAASLSYAGRLSEATEVMKEVAESAHAAAPRIRAFAAEWRAQLAAALGDLSARRAASGEAAALYLEAGDVRRAAGAECNLADAYNRFGAYAEAEAALQAALEKCRRVGNRLMEGYASLNLGYSLAMLERSREALDVLDEAAELANELRDPRLAAATRVYRSKVLLSMADEPTDGDGADVAVGGPERAAQEAADAAAQAQEAGLQSLEVSALTVAAASKLAIGDAESALHFSERAMALRDELGSVEEDEAELFLIHARALQAAGRAEEALAALERGRVRLEELASEITDAEWRARFLEDVPAHRALLGRNGD